jgi:predicted DsbA family dithiol-disulfide isomerase
MIKNLDNNEISCVYYRFSDYIKELDEKLDDGYRTEKWTINEAGLTIVPYVVIRITEEEVAAIKGSHYYLTVKSIVDKLRPVVEMIEEAEPDIKIKLDE